ncbi:MAG: hypothetical protein M3333_02185 [Actinomycetota bacterium]|nr:hypothetical protein [Actinomycetota bacterium]
MLGLPSMPPALERWGRIAGVLMLLVMVACTPEVEPSPSRPADTKGAESRGPDSGMQPFAYTEPAPEATPTAVDGTYARRVTSAQAGGAPVPCRRCAPYRFDAGRSTLTLDSGRYYVSHEPASSKVMGFASTGHFVVEGDSIVFFNDPNCTTTRGTYAWDESPTELTLTPRHDSCGIGLRAEWLSALPWIAHSDS